MKAFFEKGEGRGKFIFGLLLLFTVVYVAWKIIPVMIKVYSFEDAVKEECKFLHGRSLEELKADLVKAARADGLPVTEEDISISQFRSEEHQELKVDIAYTVQIVTPVYVYNWNQAINYQAPTFE